LELIYQGQALDDSTLISNLTTSEIRAKVIPNRSVWLSFAQFGHQVRFDSSQGVSDVVVPYLRQRFHFPVGRTRLRYNLQRIAPGPLGALETAPNRAITFHPSGYVVIPMRHQAFEDYFVVPESGTFLDLISVMQIRRGPLNLPLADLRLLDKGDLLRPEVKIADWAAEQRLLALRVLTCKRDGDWDPNDQVEVHVKIAGRQDRLMFPAMATLAYVRSRIGAKYHVLWDNIWFEPDADRSQRLRDIPDLDSRVFTLGCSTHRVGFSFAGKAPIPINVPVLSQVCDLRLECGSRAEMPPYNLILRTPLRQLGDEERLNDIVGTGSLAIMVKGTNMPVNRLYFRVNGRKVIKDVAPDKTFAQLAEEFGGRPVTFELDRQLLSRSTRVDKCVGHPRRPIYVVKRRLLLPMATEDGDFYVTIDEKMTIRELRAALPEFADAAAHRFQCGSRVLDADEVIMAINPDLLPITVEKCCDIG
jgi:hypothetical protein